MGARVLKRLHDKHGVPFIVRSFDAADRPALEAMYDDFDPKRAAQGLPPLDAEARRRWLDRTLPKGHQLVIEVDGKLVGHVMLVPYDPDTLELANFLHQSAGSWFGGSMPRSAAQTSVHARGTTE